MQVNVTCRHMDVTPSLREHALSKVEHDFQEFPRVESVHVILETQKHRHIAEVVVHAKNHIHIEGDASSDDMYHSINDAVEKAARQLRKKRDKTQDHRHSDSLAEVEAATAPKD